MSINMIVTTKCGAALASLHFRNPAFIDQSQTDIQTLIIFRFRFIIIRLLVGYITFGRLISIWQTNAFLPTILCPTNKQLWQLRCQQGQGLYLSSIFLAARAIADTAGICITKAMNRPLTGGTVEAAAKPWLIPAGK